MTEGHRRTRWLLVPTVFGETVQTMTGYDIADDGTVAGTLTLSSGVSLPVLWPADGPPVLLSTPTGKGEALDISADGRRIFGTIDGGDFVEWNRAGGVLRRLDLDDMAAGTTYGGATDDGVFVGSLSSGHGFQDAMALTGDRVIVMDPPAGLHGAHQAATAVSPSGAHILGTWSDHDPYSSNVYWSAARFALTGPARLIPGAQDVYPYRVNDAGLGLGRKVSGDSVACLVLAAERQYHPESLTRRLPTGAQLGCPSSVTTDGGVGVWAVDWDGRPIPLRLESQG